jgi:hypothetical protein
LFAGYTTRYLFVDPSWVLVDSYNIPEDIKFFQSKEVAAIARSGQGGLLLMRLKYTPVENIASIRSRDPLSLTRVGQFELNKSMNDRIDHIILTKELSNN